MSVNQVFMAGVVTAMLYGSVALASPTDNEYVICEQMVTSAMKICSEESPTHADSSCQEKARKIRTDCHDSVRKSHQTDEGRIKSQKAAEAVHKLAKAKDSSSAMLSVTLEVSFAPNMLLLSGEYASRVKGFAEVHGQGGLESVTIECLVNENSSAEYRMGLSNRRGNLIKDILVSVVIGPMPQIAPKKHAAVQMWQGGMRRCGRPM